MQNQRNVWENIAEEWNEFKSEKPAMHTLEFLKSQKGNVLDFGSGSGRHLTEIKNGKMYLVDFSEKMLELAKKKAEREKIPSEFFVVDFGKEKLPLRGDFFDAAICISSLHCIPKIEHEFAAKELCRVLKPKAKVEVGVWNKNSFRFRNAEKEKFVKWRDKGERYYYLFEEKEILELFRKNGFRIIKKYNSQMMVLFIAEKV